jgi:hypothetical protein
MDDVRRTVAVLDAQVRDAHTSKKKCPASAGHSTMLTVGWVCLPR